MPHWLSSLRPAFHTWGRKQVAKRSLQKIISAMIALIIPALNLVGAIHGVVPFAAARKVEPIDGSATL